MHKLHDCKHTVNLIASQRVGTTQYFLMQQYPESLSQYMNRLDDEMKSHGINQYPSPCTDMAFTIKAMSQIGCALGYMHRLNIAHSDMKPQNILISHRGDAVVVDFDGACFATADGSFTARTHTDLFMAPEMQDGKKDHQRDSVTLTTAVDWWGLGVLGLVMVMGPNYFRNRTMLRLMTYTRSVLTHHLEPCLGACPLLDLLCDLLAEDPSESLSSYVTFKQHPAFSHVNWADLEAPQSV